MTALTGYIQGLGGGEKRTVDKQGKEIKLSVFDNIDRVIVFNEAGETSQKTLTGKNLFHLSSSPITITGVTLEETAEGITISGSPSTYIYTNLINGTLPVGSYVIKDSKGGSSYTHQLVLYKNGSTLAYITTGQRAFTVDNTSDVWTVRLYVYSDNTDTIIQPQLETGSEPTTYEPYCGGIPSPNPSYPQDIEGIGVKQLDDTYSVTINYDDGDGRTGSVIASGLAYPLYEGDILDFANSKVIRANNYYTYSSAQYYGTFGADNAPLYYVLITDYNTKPIKNMQNSTFLGRLYSNMLIKITASSTPNMNNNEIRTEEAATPSRFYFRADQFADLTDLNNHLSNNNLIVAAELQNTLDEPITITGDISDIGTATVTADGALTVKYDKVEMAIRKYS